MTPLRRNSCPAPLTPIPNTLKKSASMQNLSMPESPVSQDNICLGRCFIQSRGERLDSLAPRFIQDSYEEKEKTNSQSKTYIPQIILASKKVTEQLHEILSIPPDSDMNKYAINVVKTINVLLAKNYPRLNKFTFILHSSQSSHALNIELQQLAAAKNYIIYYPTENIKLTFSNPKDFHNSLFGFAKINAESNVFYTHVELITWQSAPS
jgi:hypothetical protein